MGLFLLRPQGWGQEPLSFQGRQRAEVWEGPHHPSGESIGQLLRSSALGFSVSELHAVPSRCPWPGAGRQDAGVCVTAHSSVSPPGAYGRDSEEGLLEEGTLMEA